MTDLVAARALLEVQLADLEARQARIGEALAEPLNADSAEQAVEMEDDAALEGQGVIISREIGSVRRALQRIEDGTYGECVRRGDRPGPPRRPP